MSPEDEFELVLYVAGQTPRSSVARVNLQRVCDAYLTGRFRVEVIDLVEQPSRAFSDGIIAIPTLVRKHPAPVRKIIGDLSDTQHVVRGLELTGADGDVA